MISINFGDKYQQIIHILTSPFLSMLMNIFINPILNMLMNIPQEQQQGEESGKRNDIQTTKEDLQSNQLCKPFNNEIPKKPDGSSCNVYIKRSLGISEDAGSNVSRELNRDNSEWVQYSCEGDDGISTRSKVNIIVGVSDLAQEHSEHSVV